MTATKKTPKYDPKGPITAFQIKRIMHNCAYQVETKNEWVQWATADVTKTSLKSITQEQAVKIINAQTGGTAIDNYEWFDHKNTQHKYIQSLLHSIGKTKQLEDGKTVANIAFFAEWLKTKSPIIMPLNKMTVRQVQKVIYAFEQVVKYEYS